MGSFESRIQALRPARRPLPRGFTLTELIVVICIVAVLGTVLIERLVRIAELAEKTEMEQNLAAINVALTMKFAALVVARRGDEIRREVGANPIDLLAKPPENYLGELASVDPASLPAGSWYFDRGSGELVYIPARARYLDAPSGLRFRVTLAEPGSRPGQAPLDELAQPYIRPVVAYRWDFG
jgi:prepilin-type N-terminal cleavage/methylation domain-containing protein